MQCRTLRTGFVEFRVSGLAVLTGEGIMHTLNLPANSHETPHAGHTHYFD